MQADKLRRENETLKRQLAAPKQLPEARQRLGTGLQARAKDVLQKRRERDEQKDEEKEEDDGKRKFNALAVKCDLCAERGDMACIYNCPCGAIDRIDPQVLLG